MHPFQRFSAWLLVVLGSLLLVSGLFALVDAVIHHDWGLAVFTLLLLAVVAVGTLRGVRQLRHHDG